MQVAQTILAQLGGNKFLAMTGAKSLVGSDNSLTFKIGRGATNKATHCRITLEISDTYTVEFFQYRSLDMKPLSKVSGAYCDNLRAVFESATGMRTSL